MGEAVRQTVGINNFVYIIKHDCVLFEFRILCFVEFGWSIIGDSMQFKRNVISNLSIDETVFERATALMVSIFASDKMIFGFW